MYNNHTVRIIEVALNGTACTLLPHELMGFLVNCKDGDTCEVTFKTVAKEALFGMKESNGLKENTNG